MKSPSLSSKPNVSSKRQRKNTRNKRRRKKTRKQSESKHGFRCCCWGMTITSVKETLCTREYLLNKYNILRILILIITLILVFVCLLYAIGSILTLELKVFWCDEYSWNSVTQHNKIENSSTGVGGCYTSKGIFIDEGIIYATDKSNTGLAISVIDTPISIFECILFFTIVMLLIFVFIKHLIKCCIDCNKTLTNEWYVLCA